MDDIVLQDMLLRENEELLELLRQLEAENQRLREELEEALTVRAEPAEAPKGDRPSREEPVEGPPGALRELHEDLNAKYTETQVGKHLQQEEEHTHEFERQVEDAKAIANSPLERAEHRLRLTAAQLRPDEESCKAAQLHGRLRAERAAQETKPQSMRRQIKRLDFDLEDMQARAGRFRGSYAEEFDEGPSMECKKVTGVEITQLELDRLLEKAAVLDVLRKKCEQLPTQVEASHVEASEAAYEELCEKAAAAAVAAAEAIGIVTHQLCIEADAADAAWTECAQLRATLAATQHSRQQDVAGAQQRRAELVACQRECTELREELEEWQLVQSCSKQLWEELAASRSECARLREGLTEAQLAQREGASVALRWQSAHLSRELDESPKERAAPESSTWDVFLESFSCFSPKSVTPSKMRNVAKEPVLVLEGSTAQPAAREPRLEGTRGPDPLRTSILCSR